MSGDGRNAALSRAAMVVVAGGALVALTQRVPGLEFGLAGKAILIAGGAVVVLGLVMAVRSFNRGEGADQ